MKIINCYIPPRRSENEDMPYDKFDASCNRYYREPYKGCREYEPEINGMPMHIFQRMYSGSGGENG